MKKIFKYSLPNGKVPFDEWINTLDKSVQIKVLARITKMQSGFYGVYKKLSKGVLELKLVTEQGCIFLKSKILLFFY